MNASRTIISSIFATLPTQNIHKVKKEMEFRYPPHLYHHVRPILGTIAAPAVLAAQRHWPAGTNVAVQLPEKEVGEGSAHPRFKTELCKNVSSSGQCRYGENCQFAHDISELRVSSRHKKFKTDICRSWQLTPGHCPYGNRCHFIHNETESQLTQLRLKVMSQQQNKAKATALSTEKLQLKQVDSSIIGAFTSKDLPFDALEKDTVMHFDRLSLEGSSSGVSSGQCSASPLGSSGNFLDFSSHEQRVGMLLSDEDEDELLTCNSMTSSRVFSPEAEEVKMGFNSLPEETSAPPISINRLSAFSFGDAEVPAALQPHMEVMFNISAPMVDLCKSSFPTFQHQSSFSDDDL